MEHLQHVLSPLLQPSSSSASSDAVKIDLSTDALRPLWTRRATTIDTTATGGGGTLEESPLDLLCSALARAGEERPGGGNVEKKKGDNDSADVLVSVLDLMFVELGAKGMTRVADALGQHLHRRLATLGLGCNNLGEIIGDNNDNTETPVGVLSLCRVLSMTTLPNLQQLFLFQNALGDRGVAALCETLSSQSAPKLKLLGLGDNNIGIAGAKAVAKLITVDVSSRLAPGSGATLTTLLLRLNPLGEEGASTIARALRGNSSLTNVDLRFTDLCGTGETLRNLHNAVNEGNLVLTTLSVQEKAETWYGDAKTFWPVEARNVVSQSATDPIDVKVRLDSLGFGTAMYCDAQGAGVDSGACHSIAFTFASCERNKQLAAVPLNTLVAQNKFALFFKELKSIAEKPSDPAHAKYVVQSVTPLHLACALGKLEFVKAIVTTFADAGPWNLSDCIAGTHVSCSDLASGPVVAYLKAAPKAPSSQERWDLASTDDFVGQASSDVTSSPLYVQFFDSFQKARVSAEKCDEYARLFVENGVDAELLDDLDDSALRSLGVSVWGDRQKILKQIGTHELCAHAPSKDVSQEVTTMADWILQEGIVGRSKVEAMQLAQRLASEHVSFNDFSDPGTAWSAEDLFAVGFSTLGQQKRTLSAIERLKVRNQVDNRLLIKNVERHARLGSGVGGVVFRGTLDGTTDVAMKMLYSGGEVNSNMSREFFNEVQTLSALRHPNVLQFFGVYIDDKAQYFIVMEIMELGDLAGLLKGNSARASHAVEVGLNLSELSGKVRVLLDVGSACMYLESRKIVHRDIAGRNVLVNQYGTSKLSDFGLGRSLDSEAMYTQQTKVGLPYKTTAPEALKFRTFTSQSDCWAYGCLIWEVLHGKTELFANWNPTQVAQFLAGGNRLKFEPEMSELASCPRDLEDLMLRCWANEPALRPTFSEICDVLRRLRDTNPIEIASLYSSSATVSRSESLKGSLKGNLEDNNGYLDDEADSLIAEGSVGQSPVNDGAYRPSDKTVPGLAPHRITPASGTESPANPDGYFDNY